MLFTHLMDIELSKLDIFVLIVNDDWKIVPDIVLLYKRLKQRNHRSARQWKLYYIVFGGSGY